MFSTDISVDVKERICTLATYPNGWAKELRIVDWNHTGDRIDIRDWENPNNEDDEVGRMSRGLALRETEARALMEGLIKYFGKEA